MNLQATDGNLDTADAVARAAHLWLRGLGLNTTQDVAKRQALAGGLVAGLCDQLILNAGAKEVVAYVYALLNDEGPLALAISRRMLEPPAAIEDRKAYDRGLAEAARVIDLLLSKDKNLTPSA